MKSVFKSTLFLMLLFICSSCTNTTPYDESILAPQSSLAIFTRSDATLNYPIQVYAFDAEGVCAATESIASAADPLALTLAAGSYRIVAISGATDAEYTSLGATPSLSATIAMKSGNYATSSPLMVGSADVTLADKSATADITLNYAVTSITTALSGVPTDAEAVSITFSSFAETLSLDGTTAGSAPAEISCTKQPDGIWTHPAHYTFAGIGAQTILSISITSDSETHTYGYTYAAPLKASTPFILQGSYKDGLIIDGEITNGAWGTPVSIEFPFGPNGGDGGGTDPEFPTVGALWNGCLVASVSNATSTSVDVRLLSPKEWTELPTADAPAAITAYTHNSWTDWRMPTQDEAKQLVSTFGMKGAFDKANKALAEAGLSPLSNDGEVRYLCNDGLHSYIFSYGSSVTSSGDKRTYNMRAIRTMQVTAK